jgi:multiple sugar transport system ATP-binding protein
MASVEIVDVRKSYAALEVIHGVNVKIRDGEFVVLVGPSGCGKSTLLRMIAGLETISGGEVRIGSATVNHVLPKDRDIAMVFQNYALYPHMTVAENMGFSLRLKGASSEEKSARVNSAAEILGLTELLPRYPRQLSGGQRQRVAMGRAIVRNPQVFLFDEPLSNLDAKLRVQMRAEIKELHQRLETTTVYVTHDQIEAMTMADRIVVMRDGLIEQVGTPLELYDRPANRFVAGFIGSPSMNFLDGEIGDGAFLTDAGHRLPIGDSSGWKRGDRAVLGVRPEHLSVADPGMEGALSATIAVVEPTGSETLVQAHSGKTRITAAFRERHNLKAGETIWLRPDQKHTHLFTASGESYPRPQVGEL